MPLDGFYIAAHEAGQSSVNLPTWAGGPGGVRFDRTAKPVSRKDISEVPGAFQLLGVLSTNECEQFITVSESLGYHVDAPVSLPHSVRHNHNVNWVVDESIDGPIWARCAPFVTECIGDGGALGLNARFRFYRYQPGDFFKPHTDGAWPGSGVRDGRLIHDAYGDRMSWMTCLLFLNQGYAGGRTLFYPRCTVDAGDPTAVAVATPEGAALCFPHGAHPQHCLHAGEVIESGTKYIIRTDILYPL